MQQLRYVVAVVRTGNFSRAAGHCHVSQPSLSQQVQKLEEELGERLFDRLGREARLTAAGVAFVRRARRILEEAEAAVREVGEMRELLRGEVRVGVLPTIAPYLLPELIVGFAGRYPGVELVIEEDTTARLLELSLNCEIDFAIGSHPVVDERLEIRQVMGEELLLALPMGHRLLRRELVGLEDLEGERLIVMKEGHCLGELVRQFCGRPGGGLAISFSSAQLETVQALVGTGFGLSLIPAMAAREGAQRGVEYRSFRAPGPRREIIAWWARGRPLGRAAAALLGLLPRGGAGD